MAAPTTTTDRPCLSRVAFTLIELLVVVAIIAAIMGVLLPALQGARRQGRSAVCLARLRELGQGFGMYAADFEDRCMPAAYWTPALIGDGPPLYWWGVSEPGGVDLSRGFLWSYIAAGHGETTVLECPMQPWGTYRPQGPAGAATSTYGYNGYYLTPEHTPGWGLEIGHRPWLSSTRVRNPSSVFAFGDAMLDLGGSQPTNNPLLDPPHLFQGGQWTPNGFPTTAFRHQGGAQLVHVDGHAARCAAQGAWLTSPAAAIGAVGLDNAPHYVPDWLDWMEDPAIDAGR